MHKYPNKSNYHEIVAQMNADLYVGYEHIH